MVKSEKDLKKTWQKNYYHGSTSAQTGRIKNFLFFLSVYAVICLIGFVVEIGFRYHYSEKGWPKMYKAHPDIGWVNRAGWHGIYQHRTVNINNLGLRDLEDVGPKQAHECRILLLGDSITFGYDVDFKDTYGEQLEKMLNDHKRTTLDYRVLNSGVLGYNTAQEAEFLRLKGVTVKPDLIIVGYCLNDTAPLSLSTARMLHVYNVSANRFNEFFMEHSATYFYITKFFHKHIAKKLLSEKDTDTFFTNRVSKEDEYLQVGDALRKICTIARGMSCPVILAVFPTEQQFDSKPVSFKPQIRLKTVVKDINLYWLDLASSYGAHISETLFLNDKAHPNPRGHYLVARDIFQLIKEKGLLDYLQDE
jgi:lysophospholipase L1-like esterase